MAATVFYSLDVFVDLSDMLYTWIQLVLYSKQLCLQFIYHCETSHEMREEIDTGMSLLLRGEQGREGVVEKRGKIHFQF